MFCPKCGSQLADDAKFCGACGANLTQEDFAQNPSQGNPAPNMGQSGEQAQPDRGPFAEQAQAQPDMGQPNAGGAGYGNYNNGAPLQTGPEMKKGTTKAGPVIGIVAVAAVAIVVIVFAVKALFGGGYESKLDDIADLINDQETDVDKYVDELLPGFVADAYHDAVDIMKDEDEDAYDDMMDKAQEQLENAFDSADDLKISYKVTDKEKLDSDDLDDIADSYKKIAKMIPLDDLEDSMSDEIDEDAASDIYDIVEKLVDDMKDLDISAGYKLELEITLESDDDEQTQDVDVTMIKVDGDWMIDYVSILDDYNLLGSLQYMF